VLQQETASPHPGGGTKGGSDGESSESDHEESEEEFEGDSEEGSGGESEEDSEGEGEDYEVNAILDKRVNAETSEFEYLINWVGFNDDWNTWEPAESLPGCEEVLDEFEDEAVDFRMSLRLEKEMAAAKEVCNSFGSVALTIGVLPQAKLKRAKAARLSRQDVQAFELEKSRHEKRVADGEVVCSSCHTAVQCSSCYKNKPHKGDYLCKDATACGLRLDPDQGQPSRRRTRSNK